MGIAFAGMVMPSRIGFVNLLAWYLSALRFFHQPEQLLALPLHVFGAYQHEHLACLSQIEPKAQKINAVAERRNPRFLGVQFKFDRPQLRHCPLHARLQVSPVVADDQKIVHVAQVVPGVKLLFAVVVKSVEHRDTNDLDELAAGIVSRTALVLFPQYPDNHLINIVRQGVAEQFLGYDMVHGRVIAVDVELRDISILTMLPVVFAQKFFQSASCRVRPFAFLTSEVVIDESVTHYRVNRVVVKTALVNPVPERNAGYLSRLRRSYHKSNRRSRPI